jgi:hypothetical protein
LFGDEQFVDAFGLGLARRVFRPPGIDHDVVASTRVVYEFGLAAGVAS